MKKILVYLGIVVIVIIIIKAIIGGGGGRLNTNQDCHFDEYGYLITDSLEPSFELQKPNLIKFFVEVSGSMNGFFRANQRTDFKTDIWNIISYFSQCSDGVTILTNNGDEGAKYEYATFRNMMNTGSFVSTASTKVPTMLESILANIKPESGEVAVLISDMKYDPVGQAAPDVLLSQYSTDIAEKLGKYNKAVCLIGAVSNYLDKRGMEICNRSPYYYLVIGEQGRVAQVRNQLSTLLNNANHFVDNIESGFNFVRPKFSFGIYNKCTQMEEEPTFMDYQETDGIDTCYVELKVKLEDYRWMLSDEECFKNSFHINSIYGSEVEIGNIEMHSENITGKEYELNRISEAKVTVKVFNMATESEVLEWGIDLPDTNISKFSEFFDGAVDVNDPSKSYSVIDFIKGMFYGSVVNKKMENNYILISKKS